MSREIHVRFCEGAGGQFPRATRLVLGFQHEADAVRFRTDLERRLGRFGLEVHPDKTRLFERGEILAVPTNLEEANASEAQIGARDPRQTAPLARAHSGAMAQERRQRFSAPR